MAKEEMEGVLTEYRCATCREWHKTAEDAHKCFKRGVAVSLVPKGTIVAVNGEADMAFVVGEFRIGNYQHSGSYRLSGFRDTHMGDNTDYQCGDELMHIEYVLTGNADPRYYPLPESDKWLREVAHDRYAVNTNTPAFKRAVEFVKSEGLVPRYWDGKELKSI